MQRGLQDVDFGFEDEDEDDLMGQDNGDNNNGPQSSSSKGSLFSIFQKYVYWHMLTALCDHSTFGGNKSKTANCMSYTKMQCVKGYDEEFSNFENISHTHRIADQVKFFYYFCSIK